MINISIGSPGWIEIDGKRRTVYLGDAYSFSDEVGQNLIDTCTTARIVFQSKVEDLVSVPSTPTTSIDLISSLIAESNQSAQNNDYSPDVPLDLGTHWTVVLNYLNSIEEVYPVDLVMAKAIADKFPTYTQVVNNYKRMILDYSSSSETTEVSSQLIPTKLPSKKDDLVEVNNLEQLTEPKVLKSKIK